jgi:hypothetical protein
MDNRTEPTNRHIPDRRRFLKLAGGWSIGVILSAVGWHYLRAEEEEPPFESPGYPRPPLADACLQPVTNQEKILAAMVDAVVPGSGSDPTGDPGALEACAMNLLLDEYYPFRGYASLIATLMDQIATTKFGSTFLEISHGQRLEVVIHAQETLPVLRLAYRAIRSAFYGGAYNGIGSTYVSYPGPNLGYRHLKEASFRMPVCKELSDTGWLP